MSMMHKHRGSGCSKRVPLGLCLAGAVALATSPVLAQVTVNVDGAGAPNTPGGPYTKLSLAMDYLNSLAPSPSPDIINIRTNSLTDDREVTISRPVTINGDGQAVPDGIPALITVDTDATDGVRFPGHVGNSDNFCYIEVAADGNVVLNDLILVPNQGGSTTTVDAIRTYRPPTGPSTYTFNRVVGTAGTASAPGYLDPETATDIYYASGVRRWYAYLDASGIFYIGDGGGGGTYDVVMNDCKLGAARSHCLNITSAAGSVTVNRGFIGHAGTHNVRLANATDVRLLGTPTNRLRIYNGNRSSGGHNIQASTSTITQMEYVDSIQATGTGVGLRLVDSTVTSLSRSRFGLSNAGQLAMFGSSVITEARYTTFHGTGAAPNPVVTDAAWGGAALFRECIFTSSPGTGQLVLGGGGTVDLDTCAIVTETSAGENLDTATPINATSTVNETGTLVAAPFYFATSYNPTSASNLNYLATTNGRAVAGPAPTGYAGAAIGGGNFSGGGRFLLGYPAGTNFDPTQTATVDGAVITNPAGPSGGVLEVVQVAGDANTLVAAGLPATRDTTKYWNVNLLSGTPPAIDLTLNYPDAQIPSQDGRIFRYTGTNWTTAGSFVSDSTAGDPNTVTHGSISSFGAFAVGQFTCTYSFDQATLVVPAAGGPAAVNVIAADASCAWTATTPGGSFVSPNPNVGAGSGSGVLNFTVASNAAGLPRQTVINLTGGGVLKVLQQGGVSGTVIVDGVGDGEFGGGNGIDNIDSIADALLLINGTDGIPDTIAIEAAALPNEPAFLVNGTAGVAGARNFTTVTDDVTINGQYDTPGTRAHVAILGTIGGTIGAGFDLANASAGIELANGQNVNLQNLVITPQYVGSTILSQPALYVDEATNVTALGAGTGVSISNVLVTAVDNTNTPVTNLGSPTPANTTRYGGNATAPGVVAFLSNELALVNDFVHSVADTTIAHSTTSGLYIGADGGAGAGVVNINSSTFNRHNNFGVSVGTAENTTVNANLVTCSNNGSRGFDAVYAGQTVGAVNPINIGAGCDFSFNSLRGLSINTQGGATTAGRIRLTIAGTAAQPVLIRSCGNRPFRSEVTGTGTPLDFAPQIVSIDHLWVLDGGVYGFELNEFDFQFPDNLPAGPGPEDGPTISNSIFANNGGTLADGCNFRIADTNTNPGGIRFFDCTFHNPRDGASPAVYNPSVLVNAAVTTNLTIDFTECIFSGTTNTLTDMGFEFRAGTANTVNFNYCALVQDGVDPTYNLDAGVYNDTAGGNTINELPVSPSLADTPNYQSVTTGDANFLRVNTASYCTAGIAGGILSGARPTAVGLCGAAPIDGDANNDGIIDLADATLVYNVANSILPLGAITGDGDVNEDTNITNADADAIVQFLVNGTPIP